MIVTCQSCLRNYKLDETRLKPSGSKVQCSQCKAIFTVYPPAQGPAIPDAVPAAVETTPAPTATSPNIESKITYEDAVSRKAGRAEERMAPHETDDTPKTRPEPPLAFETEQDPDLADADEAPPKTLSTADKERGVGPKMETALAKKGCLPMMILLLLLPAVAYGALVLLDKKGVSMPWLKGLNLPYISQSLDSMKKEPFKMISAININSRIVRNSKGRPLFVISGKLANRGDTPQQAVQIKGTLFDETNTILAEKMVVGGRFLSDLDLIALDPKAIDAKLTATDTAPVVDAGASIPFMVVFFDLDESLKEFSVKVMKSEPVS